MENGIYIGIEDAAKEIRQRQGDVRFVAEAERLLQDGGPRCPIPMGSHAFLARNLASARLEDILFARRAAALGLAPVWLTYENDVFHAGNGDKLSLVRLVFSHGVGRNGGAKQYSHAQVVEHLDCCAKRRIGDLTTSWDEGLGSFHLRLRNVAGLSSHRIVDLGDWLRAAGPAREYYRKFFLACAVRGVLFESFDAPWHPALACFKTEVAEPAFAWVTERLARPLIVLHPDLPDDLDAMTETYPAELEMVAGPPPPLPQEGTLLSDEEGVGADEVLPTASQSPKAAVLVGEADAS